MPGLAFLSHPQLSTIALLSDLAAHLVKPATDFGEPVVDLGEPTIDLGELASQELDELLMLGGGHGA